MSDWLDTLLTAPQDPCALVTVVATRGSAPRETGARMLVWDGGIAGTIGGGNLEYQAIEQARERLRASGGEPAVVRRFALGPSLGQCCGGVVELLFETVSGSEACFTRLRELRATQQSAALVSVADGPQSNARALVTAAGSVSELRDGPLRAALQRRAGIALADGDGAQLLTLTPDNAAPVQAFCQPFRPSAFQVLVFGAGHVGRALVPLLAQLPCDVRWIDPRADEFPRATTGNVTRIVSDTPEHCVDDASPGSFYLVMTHSHPLDQAICERVLRRGDFAYCGLIGSRAKRRKFEKRLRSRGLATTTLERLVCPIGVSGIDGKRPAEIAVAVAAQLLIEYGRHRANEEAPAPALAARGE